MLLLCCSDTDQSCEHSRRLVMVERLDKKHVDFYLLNYYLINVKLADFFYN